MVSGGGSTWNEAVLVALPCGVTMVIGPDVASRGTMAVIRRSTLLLGALVKVALAQNYGLRTRKQPDASFCVIPITSFYPSVLQKAIESLAWCHRILHHDGVSAVCDSLPEYPSHQIGRCLYGIVLALESKQGELEFVGG